MKHLIGSNQETLGMAERVVAGSMAGAIAQSSIYPMEVRNHFYNRDMAIYLRLYFHTLTKKVVKLKEVFTEQANLNAMQ